MDLRFKILTVCRSEPGLPLLENHYWYMRQVARFCLMQIICWRYDFKILFYIESLHGYANNFDWLKIQEKTSF